MTEITPSQFLVRQPAFPDKKPSDQFFLNLSNTLLRQHAESGLLAGVPDVVMQRVAICVVGYYQDILSDAGLWRGFTSACRRLYGHPVPFYDQGEDYVDFEINRIDVRFIVWYSIAMLDESRRDLFPLDNQLCRLADLWFETLDSLYDEAPMPEEYNIAFELDLHQPEDNADVARFSHWLFLHSYLITPAFSSTLGQIVAQAKLNEEGGEVRLNALLEEAMGEQPVGPLALYLREWLYLILHDRMPREEKQPASQNEPHKFYRLVTEATGGKERVYIDSYPELNSFLIEKLGWDEGEEHLPQMKTASGFVIMVNRDKGMLIARNVAKCIADPENPCYNKAYARRHAFDLLTVRGLCPPDLLQAVLKNNWLPDARFPQEAQDENTPSLALKNADFIARCYLQLFYRGD